MISKKLLLISASSLLTIGAIISVMGQKATTTAANSSILATTPVMLVEEDGQQAIFLEIPSQKQKNQLSDLLKQNPQLTEDRNVKRRVYETKVIGFDKLRKKQLSKAFIHHEVKFKDEATAEEYTLDLLSYEGGKGRKFLAEPGSGTPDLIPNPNDPSQKVFVKNNGFYILDTKTLQVRAIGDQQARNAIVLRRKALPSDGFILHWALRPIWLSDGRTIAFISNRDGIEPGSDHRSKVSVWIHDIATGQEYKVDESNTSAPRTVGWTSDGRILIVEHDLKQGGTTLVAIDPKTKQKQELASGNFVAQSDNGQTVLYSKQIVPDSPAVELYALSISTGTSQLLYKSTAEEFLNSYRADFSADGTRIVTDLIDNKGTQILFIYNLLTKEAKRLTLPPGKTTSTDVKWLGNELVVPIQSLNLQNLTSETLLMSVQ